MRTVYKFLVGMLCGLCLIGGFATCQKVELPSEEGEDTEQSGQTGGKQGSNTGGEDPSSVEKKAFTVAEVRLKVDTLGYGFETWVKGYIVGACNPSGRKPLFTIEEILDAAVVSNLLIADSMGERDYSRCMPIELSNDKKGVRDIANLVEHPENLGRRIGLYGLVQEYFGKVGLKKVVSLGWLSDAPVPKEPEEQGGQDEHENNEGGEDSSSVEKKVLTVAEAQLKVDTLGYGFESWVKGYIVGACNPSVREPLFMIEEILDAGVVSNLLIADSLGERDYSRCMPIELKKGTDVRDIANLVEHPENLGRMIGLYGLVEEYFGKVGLKKVTFSGWLSDVPVPEGPKDKEKTKEPKDTITIDTVSGKIIEGGRSIKHK